MSAPGLVHANAHTLTEPPALKNSHLATVQEPTRHGGSFSLGTRRLGGRQGNWAWFHTDFALEALRLRQLVQPNHRRVADVFQDRAHDLGLGCPVEQVGAREQTERWD